MSKTLDLGTMFNILGRHNELWSTLGSGPKSKAKPKLHFTSHDHDLLETICEFRQVLLVFNRLPWLGVNHSWAKSKR